MNSLNKNKNNYSIILMKDSQSPKHFNVNKRQVKLVLLAAPALMIASLITISLFIFYFSKIKIELISERPKLISTYEAKIEEIETKIKKLNSQNFNLKEKLIFSENTPLKSLEVIKTISGADDLRSKQLVEVDQLRAFLNEKENLKINFKLTNQSKNPRVTGYFHLYLTDKESINFYPGARMNVADLRYDEGEYFSTARFRPVSIEFKKVTKSIHPSHKLVINIFSLDGDLIFSKKVNLKEIFNEK